MGVVAAELLLSCLRGDLMPARAAEMSDDDWSTLRRYADAYQLRPILHVQLARGGIAAPANVADDLRRAHRLTAAANLRIFHQLGSVLTALRAAGIDVIVLKGPYLARFVYEHPALRPMRDIDLMVRQEDLARTVECLREHEYQTPTSATIDEQCAAGAHLDAITKHGVSPIELHWSIEGSDSPFAVSREELWERSRPVSFGGSGTVAEARALCGEDLLLHLCLHGTRHVTRDRRDLSVLKCVCDIAQAVRAFGQTLDWRSITDRARRWRAGNAVYLMLHLASEWFAAPVSPAVLAELRPPNLAPVLEWARQRILAAPAAPAEGHCPGDEPAMGMRDSREYGSSRARRLMTAAGRWIRERASWQDRRMANQLALRAWLHSPAERP